MLVANMHEINHDPKKLMRNDGRLPASETAAHFIPIHQGLSNRKHFQYHLIFILCYEKYPVIQT